MNWQLPDGHVRAVFPLSDLTFRFMSRTVVFVLIAAIIICGCAGDHVVEGEISGH